MAAWQSSNLEANGWRLHYTRTGGDKPPVVLAHGFSDDGLCWTPVAEALASEYDLIMVDSSDPIGPAEVLFKQEFFKTCKKALKPSGAILTQCESVFLHLHIIEGVTAACAGLFRHVEYMNVLLPTYPSGMIGLMVCSDHAGRRSGEDRLDWSFDGHFGVDQ